MCNEIKKCKTIRCAKKQYDVQKDNRMCKKDVQKKKKKVILYERIGTLCRHPCWSLWLEQRIAGWRSGRSEGYCKSLSAGQRPHGPLTPHAANIPSGSRVISLVCPTGRPAFHSVQPSVDRMSIAASGDGFTSSEDEGAVGAAPLGCDGHVCPAAVSIGLEVNRPPQSRALAAGRLVSRSGARLTTASCPGAFRPGGAWGADEFVDGPFHGQKPLVPPPPSSLPSMAEWPGGNAGIPQVERAARCTCASRNAATWRNRPRLPSKACKLTAALAAKAYSAAGQAASALHAMAILQVHQAKALKQCTRVSTDPGFDAEAAHGDWLRSTSDGKSRRGPSEGDVHHGGPGAQSLAQPGRDEGRRQGTLSRRPHLSGRAVRRHRRGLRPAVSAVQQQTEAIQHIQPRRDTTIHRCPRGQASVCPSPWAPSCVLQSRSAPGRIDT